MLEETNTAKTEELELAAQLKEVKIEYTVKEEEKHRVLKEQRLATLEHDGVKKRIETERIAFLERCREFRASIKKTRIEASLLVLDGGINFGVKDASNESTDLWRRLQDDDDDASSESEDDDSDTNTNTKKRKHKIVDEEMEQVVEHERETRQALIEAECALHTEKNKNEDAVKKSRDRARRITQQRAQLQRHRKEVEEAELEIQQIKDDIVSSNQLANTYEKECHRKKQNRQASVNNNGSYSNNFNPPHETSKSSSANNNPYNQYRTPQTTGTVSSSSGGYQQQGSRGGGGVTNPYNKAGGRNSNPYVSNNNSRASINANNRRQSGQQNNHVAKNGKLAGKNNAPQYASDMLHGITPEYGSQQQRDREGTQHPHRGRNIRNQRQFGTSVGVSIGDTGEDESMSDELKECMAAFSNPASSTKNTREDDDISDVSSDSSDDEDLLSFNIFGKK